MEGDDVDEKRQESDHFENLESKEFVDGSDIGFERKSGQGPLQGLWRDQ